MRPVILAALISTFAACSAGPQPVERSPRAELRMQKELAGKVAGGPVRCLERSQSNDMVAIDDQTILFRSGRARTFVNHPTGACSGLASGWYTLVTHTYGDSRLCRGDIAKVADLRTGMVVGSCVLGDFVPYTRG
jgi:hypothetical protein